MLHRLILGLAALSIASPALAEVADKEPSVGGMWAWALTVNVVALLLEMLRPRLGLIVVPFAALSAWTTHMELSDPYVGPAILRELGPSYIKMSYMSIAVELLGPMLLVLLYEIIRRRRA